MDRDDASKDPATVAQRRSRTVVATPDDLVREIDRPLALRLTSRGPIASGGMGAVTRVTDSALQRDTAKKTMHPELAQQPRMRASFVREARTTGRLEHPNIVPIHDIGVDTEGNLFFIMKLVSGRTLREMVASLPSGPLPHHDLLNLLEVVVRVCDALAFAHASGVLHCDVKASNVMVGDFGQVYLMDWGVARPMQPEPTTDDEEAEGHRGGPISGTPSHMSPEQAVGARPRLGPRSDVFLVGSLLYEVLARRPPYKGATVMATIVMAAMHRLTPVAEASAPYGVPRALVRIVEKAMAEAPDDRYASVADLKDDLVRFLRGGGAFPLRTYAAGEHIIREGEEGDAAYLLVRGRCEVYTGEGAGREVIRHMGPGEAFGEMAILTEGPRTASVVCLEPSTVEVVTRKVLEEELESLKPWMASFVRGLAKRFREREG